MAASDWCGFCAVNRSVSTLYLLKLVDVTMMDAGTVCFAKQMVTLLAEQEVVDIGAYRTAPAGLRLWGGPRLMQMIWLR